jgi:predicted transcriptional regulator
MLIGIAVCVLFYVLYPSTSITGEDFYKKFTSILIIIVFSLIIVVVVLSAVLSLKEFKNRMRLDNSFHLTYHRLSFEEVFMNQNRRQILDHILNEPGIHYNELRRKCDLNHGQFRWHLNVLIHFGIIMAKKIGQYLVFRVRGDKWNKNLELFKSTTTFAVLKQIEKNPGIFSSAIARNLGLKRNSVKHHIDKLVEKKIITLQRKGRRLELFIDPSYEYR